MCFFYINMPWVILVFIIIGNTEVTRAGKSRVATEYVDLPLALTRPFRLYRVAASTFKTDGSDLISFRRSSLSTRPKLLVYQRLKTSGVNNNFGANSLLELQRPKSTDHYFGKQHGHVPLINGNGYWTVREAHFKPRFPAPSSRFCQNWLRH